MLLGVCLEAAGRSGAGPKGRGPISPSSGLMASPPEGGGRPRHL